MGTDSNQGSDRWVATERKRTERSIRQVQEKEDWIIAGLKKIQEDQGSGERDSNKPEIMKQEKDQDTEER